MIGFSYYAFFLQNIVDEQLNLKRLADISIDIYAMTACVGRASRSYCIGLKNADHEVSAVIVTRVLALLSGSTQELQ